jgi:hypothetical protein
MFKEWVELLTVQLRSAGPTAKQAKSVSVTAVAAMEAH